MLSYLRPSTHRRTSSNTRSAELRRVGRPPLSHRLPLEKSRMVSYPTLYPLRLQSFQQPSFLHPSCACTSAFAAIGRGTFFR